jgi:hypothetical protein
MFMCVPRDQFRDVFSYIPFLDIRFHKGIISRIPLIGRVTRLGWKYITENVFGSLISPRLRKGKQLSCHMWHPFYYSCYKSGDKSWKTFSVIYFQPNLVTRPIKGILEIQNLTPCSFRSKFRYGRIVSDQLKIIFQYS